MINSFQLVAREFLMRSSFSCRTWSQEVNFLSVPQCKLSNLGRVWQMRTGKLKETDHLQREICIKQENTNCSWWGFWRGAVQKGHKDTTVVGTSVHVLLSKVSFFAVYIRRWYQRWSVHLDNWNKFPESWEVVLPNSEMESTTWVPKPSCLALH